MQNDVDPDMDEAERTAEALAGVRAGRQSVRGENLQRPRVLRKAEQDDEGAEALNAT